MKYFYSFVDFQTKKSIYETTTRITYNVSAACTLFRQ
jgi:hypothetical protein